MGHLLTLWDEEAPLRNEPTDWRQVKWASALTDADLRAQSRLTLSPARRQAADAWVAARAADDAAVRERARSAFVLALQALDG